MRWGVKYSSSKSIVHALLGILFFAVGIGLIAIVLTMHALTALQNGNFQKAATYSQIAHPLVKSIDLISLSLIPDFDAWNSGLLLVDSVSQLGQTSQVISEQLAGSDSAVNFETLANELDLIQHRLSQTNHKLASTWILGNFISSSDLDKLQQAEQKLPVLSNTLRSVAEKPNQTWVVLFQNSDEVRPTGGFAGSYALINITNGQLADIVVEDIYDADGQFTGYIDPPPGVKEYTSGSNGLRLPDANWWPDFPKSAQTQLQFLAFGDRRDISGVIAINLSVAEQLLSITGPVWLPDNNKELTAENVHTLLRAERGSFFPGSQQKKNLIDHAQSMIRQKLTQLDPHQKFQLLQLINDSFTQKDIQLYAIDPKLQQLIVDTRLGGVVGLSQFANQQQVLDCGCQPRLIMPVEANVGINKVNRYIDRNYIFQFSPNLVSISIDWQNHANLPSATNLSSLIPANQISNFITKDNQNGYVNYQRVLVDPSYELDAITADGKSINNWDEKQITTSDGTLLKQIGFLVAVPAEQESSVIVTFRTDDGFPPPIVILPKQSGIPVSQYSVVTSQDELSGFWDKDLLIQLR